MYRREERGGLVEVAARSRHRLGIPNLHEIIGDPLPEPVVLSGLLASPQVTVRNRLSLHPAYRNRAHIHEESRSHALDR